jgi:hypothetical protein
MGSAQALSEQKLRKCSAFTLKHPLEVTRRYTKMRRHGTNRKVSSKAVFDDIGFGHAQARCREPALIGKFHRIICRTKSERHEIEQMVDRSTSKLGSCQSNLIEEGRCVARQ